MSTNDKTSEEQRLRQLLEEERAAHSRTRAAQELAEERLADLQAQGPFKKVLYTTHRDEADRLRQQLREAIEAISDGFVLYDSDDRLVMFNRRYRDEFSFAPDVLVPGTRFIDILKRGVADGRVPAGYEEQQWIEERMDAHRNPPPPYLVERSDGRWTLMTEYRTAAGGLVGIRTDVTELKQQERAARESEQLMRELIDAIPALVQTKDTELRYHLVNQYFLDVWDLNREDVIGKTQEEAFADDRSPYYGQRATDRDRWVLDNKRPTGTYEVSYPRADGRTLSLWAHKLPLLDDDGEVFRVLTVGMDISDLKAAQKKIEEQREALHQSEKLTALGSLLAGVAHELNNPLSIVVGRAALLKEQVKDPQVAASIGKIQVAADRCGRIVKTFLAMARQRTPVRKNVDLKAIIGDALQLVDYSFRSSGVETEISHDARLAPIEGDADELIQVFSNLLVNAEQALSSSTSNRRVTIRTYMDDVQMATIEIEDNGPGIAEEIRDRIFEPFFTTKPEGVGTGMGLSVSRGIVLAHGGRIEVETDFLQQPALGGTRFTVKLPSVVGEGGALPAEVAIDKATRPRSILVVDDETQVCELVAEIVASMGHKVDMREDGESAWRALQQVEYDLVISDLRMPRMDGQQLAGKADELVAGMSDRFLFLTGDTMSPLAHQFLIQGNRAYLRKPVAPDELRRAVDDALSRTKR